MIPDLQISKTVGKKVPHVLEKMNPPPHKAKVVKKEKDNWGRDCRGICGESNNSEL